MGIPVRDARCITKWRHIRVVGLLLRHMPVKVKEPTLGGSIDMISNAVRIAELAIDKQAQALLMPVSARRQLNDLPDGLWTRISIEFYKDAADAVFKALVE